MALAFFAMVASAAGAAVAVPTIELNNGVQMPRLAISLPKTAPEAAANIKDAFETGVTHFVTANDYLNQQAVGQGLKSLGVSRDKYFLTTMTSPCQCNQMFGNRTACKRNITDLSECAATTKKEILSDIEQLNMSYVDLILLHGPNEVAGHDGGCGPEACAANLAQWQVYTELYKAGKARAIGVGNFCPSCFDCLLAKADTVVPAVNQVQYHVAYGADPAGFMSYFHSKGIVPHVYEPLASGILASNTLCTSIGKKRNKTAAQVAMRWVSQNAISEPAILSSSTNKAYLQQDTDIFDWDLSPDEVKALDAITCTTNPELCKPSKYPGREAWGCTR